MLLYHTALLEFSGLFGMRSQKECFAGECLMNDLGNSVLSFILTLEMLIQYKTDAKDEVYDKYAYNDRYLGIFA